MRAGTIYQRSKALGFTLLRLQYKLIERQSNKQTIVFTSEFLH